MKDATPVELAFIEHAAHFHTTGRYRFEDCPSLPCDNFMPTARNSVAVAMRLGKGLPVAGDRLDTLSERAQLVATLKTHSEMFFRSSGHDLAFEHCVDAPCVGWHRASRAAMMAELVNAPVDVRAFRTLEEARAARDVPAPGGYAAAMLHDALDECGKRYAAVNKRVDDLAAWRRSDSDTIERVVAGHDQVAESLLPIVNRFREVRAAEAETFIDGQPLQFADAADIAAAVYSRLRIADTFASDDTAADEEGWSWARAEHHRGVAAVLATMYATATERELDAAVEPGPYIKEATWARNYANDMLYGAPEPDAKIKVNVTDVQRGADGITVTGVVPGALFADLGKMPVGGYSIGVPKSAVGRVKRLMPNGALVEIPGNIAVRWHDGATDELVELGRDGVERRFKDGVWTPARVDDSATVVGVDELGSVLDEIHVFTAAEDGKTVAEALADGDMVEVPGVLYDAPEGGNRIVPDADGNHYTEAPTTYAGPADTDDGVDW